MNTQTKCWSSSRHSPGDTPGCRLLRKIPLALVGLRLALGPVLLITAENSGAGLSLISILGTAFLSDVFDGVVARRLGVVTPFLRVSDSTADVLFYLFVAVAVAHLQPHLLTEFRLPLLILAALYLIRWVQDLVKYRRLASYHAHLARLSGLFLFLGAAAVFLSLRADVLLWVAFLTGVACHLEAMAITSILPEWTHDVSGFRQALYLRKTTPLYPP